MLNIIAYSVGLILVFVHALQIHKRDRNVLKSFVSDKFVGQRLIRSFQVDSSTTCRSCKSAE